MPAYARLKAEALRLSSAGLNAIPLRKKKPLGKWKRFQETRSGVSEIEDVLWERADGLGLILGPVSNVYAIDIDGVTDPTVIADWLPALGLPEDYPWVEKTGAGNYQLFFRCKDEIRKADRRSKDDKCSHIELRGSGCYSAIPPSIHPETKQAYSWFYEPPALGDMRELRRDFVLSVYKNMTVPREDQRAHHQSKRMGDLAAV